ncbi:unnamed protein product [Medioppia subpectinata]|uniref:Glutathione S-transferase n=1 Tax=Medioppia subpectinata TaxID=1979941 RepID=A0A7R9Q9G5_9ACAR|nr:unnamed protein product [Medioppia subpectinata]CAG2117079.1 unnamed protein product [Medioppia subpectinata]
MPIDLYYNKFSAPSRAAWMTARQLGLDFNLTSVDLSTGEQFKPEYIALNPLHTVPTLVDDGFALWESRAVMQFMCNRYAPDSTLYPKDAKKRALVDRSLYFDLTFTPQLAEVMMARVLMGTEPAADKLAKLDESLKAINTLIGANRYLTGDQLTIADLSLLSLTSYIDKGSIDISPYPNYQRWVQTLQQELPYYDEINNIPKADWDESLDKYRALLAAKAK